MLWFRDDDRLSDESRFFANKSEWSGGKDHGELLPEDVEALKHRIITGRRLPKPPMQGWRW